MGSQTVGHDLATKPPPPEKMYNACINMDGPRDYHTKLSKPDRERQILYDITYMWTLKKKKERQTNLFGTSLVAEKVKSLSAMQETQV